MSKVQPALKIWSRQPAAQALLTWHPGDATGW